MTINFTPTPVLYIFIGLIVGILIGWAIGFFDSNGRADKKIKIAEANAESKIREAEKKIAQADEQFSLESRLSPSVKDDPGLLRLKKITAASQLKWTAHSFQRYYLRKEKSA